jgi:KaiC/GvpD/RAD55 family RecA-like ATPase
MNQAIQPFHFNRYFQMQILALMTQDQDFLISAYNIIQPEFFSDKILIWYFKIIRDYYLDYQMRMTSDILKNEVLKACSQNSIKDDEVQAYCECYNKIVEPVASKEYISKELINFCKSQAIKAMIMEVPSYLKTYDFATIAEKFHKAMEVGEDFGSMGTPYFVNYSDRIKLRSKKLDTRAMPTGITELDIYLNGGLRPKQLGIWMAPTSRGKSLSLCHCGKRAVIMGRKVLHYTMELGEEEVSDRYDSSFSRIKMSDLAEKEYEVSSALEKLGLRWGNALIIKEYPAGKSTIANLQAHCSQCMRTGFVPDLVLVDYLDQMKPTQKRLQKREELSDLTTELRGWATELKVPIWTATQSQRIAISMETHTEEQVGEDIGKVNIADVVITLNQTREEYIQRVMRLFIAKNRNGVKYHEVKINSDLERMCFYVSPGI